MSENDGQRIASLEEENRRLREENEQLIRIMNQLKTTLNRLADRCFVNGEQ